MKTARTTTLSSAYSRFQRAFEPFVALLAIVALASPARAALLGNNPTGPSTAWDPTTTLSVSLKPNPAVFIPQGNCPWLVPALTKASQPYNNANNTWSYTYGSLAGDFQLNTYVAWVNNMPAVSFGNAPNTYSFPGKPDPGVGAAAFAITYKPKGSDPAPSTLRWMQVIATTLPSPRGVTYGTNVGGGLTAYMDNARYGDGSGSDPYYGWLTATNPADLSTSQAANGQGFMDTPEYPGLGYLNANRDKLPFDWEAQAFLTTETDSTNGAVITHNVKIWDGVWWGYTIVPEPGALSLLAMGLLFLVRVRFARRG
jgi:hypothetical protein